MNFTLLHGAWHGAWCWDFVTPLLRERGHRVSRPVLSGLGENAHFLSSEITLQTWVDELVAYLEAENMTDTVLVGHSFGGNVITGAAARVPDRIAKLIYLDAMVPQSGVAPCETVPPKVWAERRAGVVDHVGVPCLPCPPAAAFGISDAKQVEFIDRHLTPHPLRTYETAIEFDGDPNAGLDVAYIMATAPVYSSLAAHRERAKELGWPIHEIACGHDAMIAKPKDLADLLEG